MISMIFWHKALVLGALVLGICFKNLAEAKFKSNFS